MEWYSIIRHSVDVKIMVRFPKQVLLVKAQMLQQEYCASCLRNSVQPEPLDISMKKGSMACSTSTGLVTVCRIENTKWHAGSWRSGL